MGLISDVACDFPVLRDAVHSGWHDKTEIKRFPSAILSQGPPVITSCNAGAGAECR